MNNTALEKVPIHQNTFFDRALDIAIVRHGLGLSVRRQFAERAVALAEHVCGSVGWEMRNMEHAMNAVTIVKNFIAIGLEIASAGSEFLAGHMLCFATASDLFNITEVRALELLRLRAQILKRSNEDVRSKVNDQSTHLSFIHTKDLREMDELFKGSSAIKEMLKLDDVRAKAFQSILTLARLSFLEREIRRIYCTMIYSRKYLLWKDLFRQMKLVRARSVFLGGEHAGLEADLHMVVNWDLNAMLSTIALSLIDSDGASYSPCVTWDVLKKHLVLIASGDYIAVAFAQLRAFFAHRDVPEQVQVLLLSDMQDCLQKHVSRAQSEYAESVGSWMEDFIFSMNAKDYYSAEVDLYHGAVTKGERTLMTVNEIGMLHNVPVDEQSARELFARFNWDDIQNHEDMASLIEKIGYLWIVLCMPFTPRMINFLCEAWDMVTTTAGRADIVLRKLYAEYSKELYAQFRESVFEFMARHTRGDVVALIPLDYHVIEYVIADWDYVGATIHLKEDERAKLVKGLIARASREFWRDMPDDLLDKMQYGVSPALRGRLTKLSK